MFPYFNHHESWVSLLTSAVMISLTLHWRLMHMSRETVKLHHYHYSYPLTLSIMKWTGLYLKTSTVAECAHNALKRGCGNNLNKNTVHTKLAKMHTENTPSPTVIKRICETPVILSLNSFFFALIVKILLNTSYITVHQHVWVLHVNVLIKMTTELWDMLICEMLSSVILVLLLNMRIPVSLCIKICVATWAFADFSWCWEYANTL